MALNIADLKKISRIDIEKSILLNVYYSYEGYVVGDIAEFGTRKGGTAYVIAEAMGACEATTTSNETGISSKSLHLFDSFEGLPEPAHQADKNRMDVLSGAWSKGSMTGLSAEELRSYMLKFLSDNSIKIYEGFYSETLKLIAEDTKFSMVHLDSVLYLSTIEVLDYLFANKHISKGANVLFRAWNTNMSSNDSGERRAWSEVVESYGIISSEPTYYGWQCARFTVHDYKGMQTPNS